MTVAVNQKINMPTDTHGNPINRAQGVPICVDDALAGVSGYWAPVIDLRDPQYASRVFVGLSVENPSATIKIKVAMATLNPDGSLLETLQVANVDVSSKYVFDQLLFGPGVNDINGRRISMILIKPASDTGTADFDSFTYATADIPPAGSTIIMGPSGNQRTFRFVEVLGSGLAANEFEVLIGASADATWTAFVAACNLKEPRVTASINTGSNTVTITSNMGGNYWNASYLLANGSVSPGAVYAAGLLDGGSGGIAVVAHVW